MTEQDNIGLLDSFTQELLSIYPNFQFHYGHGSSYGGIVHSAGHEFIISQSVLNDSDYEFKKGNQLIHYTSVESAYSILNSKRLRLYNLFNLNDGREFEYLLHERGIQISDNVIREIKSQLFISSFCLYNENNRDDFNMWRLYGKNGSGLAIVFEILNDNYDWKDFLIGKVNYDLASSSSEMIKDAMLLLSKYINKGMILDRMPKLLAAYLLLHKNLIWSIEQEYRLLTYAEIESESLNWFDVYGKPSSLELNVWPSKRGQKIVSLSLPIVNRNDIHFEDQYPRLRISKIILGPNADESLMDDLVRLSHLYSNYAFSVEYSRYKGEL
jgi:hypothetical protein